MYFALLLVFTLSISHSNVFAKFNPLHHSGGASPYFDAPSQYGIPDETPPGCVVDQAAYILRHGARYPEPGGSFGGWLSLFTKLQNASYTAKGPLAFLPSWAPAVDNPLNQPLYLTGPGAQESFTLGVDLRNRYGLTPGGEGLTVWAASQQRVVDTAYYFLTGYLSQGRYLGNATLNRGSIVTFPDAANYTFANSLQPGDSCPTYKAADRSALADTFRATYQSAIAERLNSMLDGLQLNASDIGPMMDLCGFQTGINGNDEFCRMFTPAEWLDYEYAADINYFYGTGPGNPFAGTVGFPYIKAVKDLFVLGPNKTTEGSTFTPSSLLMSFTHDGNLAPVVAAMGLWNESTVSPLSLTSPDSRRHFRSSYLVNFRGNFALERLSCDKPLGDVVKHVQGQIVPRPGKSSNATQFVRVRINRAPVPIPGCISGPGSTCPLSDFSDYVDKRGAIVGNYIEVCGLQNVTNATDSVTYFTNIPPNSTLSVPIPVAM